MSTKDETRRRILDAARVLLRKRGVHGVGLEDVAEAAGLSRQAIYQHHFKSKSELLLALVARVAEVENVPVLVKSMDEAERGIEALDAMVATLAELDERVADISLILDGARANDAGADRAWQTRMELRRASALSVIRKLARDDVLAPGWTVPAAADFLFATLSPATHRLLTVELAWSKRQYVKRMGTALRAALVAR